MTTPTPACLRTDDGVLLAAEVWRHDAPRGVVVVSHGFSGSKDQHEVRKLATAIREAGFAVITYDSRGHGASGGMCTLGDLEQLDVAAAVDAARALGPEVGVVGASMGGIAVLRHAARDPALAAVVTVSSPAVWKVPRSAQGVLSVLLTQTWVGRRMATRRLGVRLSPRWGRCDPPVVLATRLSAPYMVVHGMRDRFVSHRQGRLLYAAAAGPCRMALVPGMGHAFDPVGNRAIVVGLEWGFGVRRTHGISTAT